MNEFAEIAPVIETKNPRLVVNEYDGSYSKHLSLSPQVLNQLSEIIGGSPNPLRIRESGIRDRSRETEEKIETYRFARVGNSDILFINSLIIEGAISHLEETKLGMHSDRHIQDERHESLFAEEFAKTVKSGIYEWSRKTLSENLRASNEGLFTRIKKNRELNTFWRKNKSSLVVLSFPELQLAKLKELQQ